MHTFAFYFVAVAALGGERLLSHYFIQGVITSAVGALPAPTKDSPQWYVFLFKFANGIVWNFGRALNTSIEKSPNWEDAAASHVEKIKQLGDAPAQ